MERDKTKVEPGKHPPRPEEAGSERPEPNKHPAGPHHADHLTDDSRTPGTGLLPDADKDGGVDAGSG